MASASFPRFHLIRLPGEFGPVVRCFGELSSATTEILQKELTLLVPLSHVALTLNVAGCRSLDHSGALTVLRSYRRMRGRGRLLMVIARGGGARALQRFQLHQIVPVFTTEEEAALSIRRGPSPPAPSTWTTALAATLIHWLLIKKALGETPRGEVLRRLTAINGLCKRSEELFREGSRMALTHCEFCPLFWERGGKPEDVGCGSLLDPIITSLQAGDDRRVRHQVEEVIRAIQAMYQFEKNGVRPHTPRRDDSESELR